MISSNAHAKFRHRATLHAFRHPLFKVCCWFFINSAAISFRIFCCIFEHFGLHVNGFWAPFWYLFEHFGGPGAVSGRLWAPLGT